MAIGPVERAQRYLREHQVMTLASYGDAGAWAAAVFYASDGFAIYFLSSPNSRHGRNLVQNPRASAAVHEDYAQWSEIKGVQMEGITSMLAAEEEQNAKRVYGAKFPLIYQHIKRLHLCLGGRLAGPMAIG